MDSDNLAGDNHHDSCLIITVHGHWLRQLKCMSSKNISVQYFFGSHEICVQIVDSHSVPVTVKYLLDCKIVPQDCLTLKYLLSCSL